MKQIMSIVDNNVFSMHKMAMIDKQKLLEKGIKSPDLSKAERIKIDSRTIIFKVRSIIHQPKVRTKPNAISSIVEPLFDNE